MLVPRAAKSFDGVALRAMCSVQALSAALSLAQFLCVEVALAEDAPPYPPLTRPLVIDQVPGAPVYFTLGSPGVPGQQNEGHTSNAGFIVTSEGVVVFDALGTPSLGWNLLVAIRKVTSLPVRYN